MTDIAFHAVAKTSDVPESDMIRVSVGKKDFALYHLGGRFYATEAYCTHGHALLTEGYVEGERVECPMHGGIFDIPTGKAVGEPCVTALPIYEVRIDGDTVSIGVPESALR